MLMPGFVLERLSDFGVAVVAREVEPGGPVGVRLELPAQEHGRPGPGLDVEVRRFSRPVSAARLAELAARPRPAGLLVIVPSASPSARRRAAELGISLIAINPGRSAGPDGHLALAPGTLMPIAEPDREPAPARRSGRAGWGTSRLLRALAEGEIGTQAQLADRTGVSQPRVSQVLKTLSQQGIVRSAPVPGEAARRAWLVQSWGDFLDYWLEHYPGPGGVRTNWYGLDPPRQQARAVTALLTRQLLPKDRNMLLVADREAMPSVLVSGDVAADEYAPWATPRQAVIYARHGADLGPARLTPSSAEDATTVLVVPEDPGVWVQMRLSWAPFRDVAARAELPLADPLQVLFDVSRSLSIDADQAVDHLRRQAVQKLSEGPEGLGAGEHVLV